MTAVLAQVAAEWDRMAATSKAETLTAQVLRDAWAVEGPYKAAELIALLTPRHRARLETDVWNALGHRVPLVVVRMSFELVLITAGVE